MIPERLAGIAVIPLDGGHLAVVDAEDYPYLTQWVWLYMGDYGRRKPGTGYAQATLSRATGRPQSVYMHRLITGAPMGMVVDHINGDPLDNRRQNLRVVTHAENSRNRSNSKGEKVRDKAPLPPLNGEDKQALWRLWQNDEMRRQADERAEVRRQRAKRRTLAQKGAKRASFKSDGDKAIWLTVEQAAERLGVSQGAIRKRIAKGKLPAIWLSPRAVRIHPRHLEDAP